MANEMPPYLLRTEPMEIEDLPLQVMLLTMEIANLRRSNAAAAALLENVARAIKPAQMRND